MKMIDEVIKALIKIGKDYPKTQSSWERFFSPHTHQAIAQKLIALGDENAKKLPEQDKVNKVKSVVYAIYQEIEKPGSLLIEIDNCLRNGSDFQSYADKCVEIQNEIDESDNKAMASESYDIQRTFNMKNYRDAIESIKPNTVHQSESEDIRDVSVSTDSHRQSSIFSIERPSAAFK